MNTAIENLFNKKASTWSSKYKNKLLTRYQVFRTALDEYPPPGKMILDIGCGTGILTKMACEIGYTVTGIDSSQQMIEASKNEFNSIKQIVKFELIEFNDIEKVYKNADGIIMSSVFEYLNKAENPLSVISKLLKEGGIAFVSIPNSFSIVRIMEYFLRIILVVIAKKIVLPDKIQDFLTYLSISRNRPKEKTFEKNCIKNNLSICKKYYYGNNGGVSSVNDFKKTMILFVLKKV